MFKQTAVVSFTAGDTVRVRTLYAEAWDRVHHSSERKSDKELLVIESTTDAISGYRILHLVDVKGDRLTAMAQFFEHTELELFDVRDKYTGELIMQFNEIDAASRFIASMHRLNAAGVWIRRHANGKENGKPSTSNWL
jgi:hypothetical protein